jgi:hypothetical protein
MAAEDRWHGFPAERPGVPVVMDGRLGALPWSAVLDPVAQERDVSLCVAGGVGRAGLDAERAGASLLIRAGWAEERLLQGELAAELVE